jgi:4-amino-4-deoxy-L-arabinose transferase-like glycosyltransferase
MQSDPETSVLDWLKTLLRNLPQRLNNAGPVTESKQPENGFANSSQAILLILGLSMALYGQYILLFPNPDFEQYELALWLETSLKLGMPNLKAQLFGAVLFLLGGSLLIYFFHKTTPLKTESNPGGKISVPLTKKIFSSWGFIATIALNILLLVQLLRRDEGNYLVILWVASLIPIIVFAWKLDRKSNIQLSPNLRRKDVIALLTVLVVGLIFGSYRLAGIPNFLMGDEGTFWTTARDIAYQKYTPSAFDFGVYTYPILSSIFQAGVMSVGGIDIWGWRFSSLLASLLSVPALYLLARELFNRQVAVLSALALVFSPYFLAFSRFGYNNSQTLFPVTFAIFFAYMGLKRSSLFYLLLAGYASGIGFYTYTAAQSGLLILGLFTFILLVQKPGQRTQVAMAGLIILFGWYLVASPHRAFGLVKDHESFQVKLGESIFFNADYATSFLQTGDNPNTKGIFFGESRQFYYEPQTWLIMNIRATLRTLMVFHTPGLVTEHMIASPLAGTAGSFFFMLGLVYSLSRLRERRNIILLSWHILTLLALSILNTFPPRHTHMVGIIPLIALWVGLGVYILAQSLSALLSPIRKHASRVFAITIMGIVIWGGLHDYFVKATQTYWPQEENIINWAALYNPDASFIFVVPPGGDEKFKPFAIREMRREVAFQTVKPDNLAATLEENPRGKTVLFFLPEVLPAMTTIADIWPQAGGNTYTNREGNPILYAVASQPDFVFSVPYGFNANLGDSFGSLAVWLVIFLTILLLIFIFSPRAWKSRLPVRIRNFANWIAESPRPLPDDEVETRLSLEQKEMPVYSQLVKETAETNMPPPSKQPVVNEQPLENEGQKPRFIEVEFKLRINLGGNTSEWPGGNPQHKTLRRTFSGWKENFLQGLTINDWTAKPLESAPILGLGFILALLAQLMLNAKIIVPGIALYMAVAGIVLYWIRNNTESALSVIEIGNLNHLKEWALFILVLAVGIFARTYNAGNFPYGIEGDESKWALQAFYSTILQVKQGVFGHHFEYQPISFFLIGYAMNIFGIDLLAPRYLNAILSCVSLILFYFALRRISNPAVALTGSFLYAVSFPALSAGRQALHDTHVEIWINLAFLTLVYGLESRKTWLMFVTGVALAAGSLTYETFYPILVVFLGYALIKVLTGSQNRDRKAWHILFITFPILLVLPQIIAYILKRENYHLQTFRNMSESINPYAPYMGHILAGLQFVAETLQTLFVSVIYPDSLTRWAGPIVNPWILPFFFIGLIIALRQARQQHNLLLITWFFLGFFGFGALGAGYPRVVFVALMPVYALAAMGMIATLNMIRSLPILLGKNRDRKLFAGFAILLLFLSIYDALIFINLPEQANRQQRRELYDMVTTSIKNAPMTVLAYTPATENAIQLESDVLDMLVMGAFEMHVPSDKYKILPISQAMAHLWLVQDTVGTVDMIVDKAALQIDKTYKQGMDTLLTCYPNHSKTETKHFEKYTISRIQSPACFSMAEPQSIAPARGDVLPAGQPIAMSWSTTSKDAKYQITIQSLLRGLIRLEAEYMTADGWYPEDKHATEFSGTGYLTDNFNAGDAQISFEIEEPGEYTIWVRTYRRVINDQVNYLTLNSNLPVEISKGGEENFNKWIWENIGPYFLEKGTHILTASRTYGTDPQFSVFLDAFIISPSAEYNPEDADPWVTIFTSEPLDGDKTSYTYLPGLPAGYYRWWISYTETAGLVNWLGTQNMDATAIDFTVTGNSP